MSANAYNAFIVSPFPANQTNYSGRKRARIRNSAWLFLRSKVHNRHYVAVFNWRKAMWWYDVSGLKFWTAHKQ